MKDDLRFLIHCIRIPVLVLLILGIILLIAGAV